MQSFIHVSINVAEYLLSEIYRYNGLNNSYLSTLILMQMYSHSQIKQIRVIFTREHEGVSRGSETQSIQVIENLN